MKKLGFKKLGFLSLIFMLAVGLFACSNANKNSNTSEKLKVVATNSIIADITKNIAGDKIDLHSIVQNAKKEENKDYYAVSDGVEVIYLEGQNEKGKEDPHAWLNLENGMIYAKNIAKQLSAKDPKNKDFYEANLKNYLEKLEALDKEAKQKFNNIPKEKKMIVTSEGCFKYFSKAYNVPSAYIWEINTEEEGTPDQIKTLVEKLRKTKVPSLFVESSVDERPMQTVSKDTNIPIFEKIFTDSVAEPGQNGDSYYNMMKWNLDKIAEGLSK